MAHLSAIDLNLLPLLDALLDERHVTRAARRVGLSQPAASRGLGRLRELFGDPLLVRSGRSFGLTPRAEALREPVRHALGLVEGALRPTPAFDPARARRTIRVTSDDYCQVVILGPLLRRLAQEAPGFDVWVLPSPPTFETQHDPLARGDVDFHFGPIRAAERRPSGVHAEHLADERFVCLAGAGHAFALEPSLERFVAARHAFVAPGGRPGGAVDGALGAQGLERHIALAGPSFVVLPLLVAETDLVVTLGERLARYLSALLPLVIVEPPIALPPFALGVLWHERDRHDPALAWLRSEIRRAIPR